MRGLFSAFALFATSLSVAAADPSWLEVAKAKDGETTFMDLNSVKSSGAHVMAWFRTVPGKPPAAGQKASTKMRIKFDCSGERSVLLSITTYRADGSVMSTEQNRIPDHDWKDVAPGSIGQGMMENACAMAPAP